MRASVYGLSVKTIFWLIFLLGMFVGICVQVYFPDVGAVIIGVLRGIGLAIVRGVYSPEELVK